jgi:dTDP-4-amino-4,6-dideoxygalactose transaminase
MIPLVPLQKQFGSLKRELLTEIGSVIDDGQYILGTRVRAFEEAAAAYVGAAHAVGVGNGTDALLLVLKAMGIGPGDEVITTPFTFIASAEAVSQAGARPVFVDIDPETYNLDPGKLERAITPRTKAIIPVHLFGQPARMDDINDIARKYGIRVIEDACQAFGAAYRGQKAGNLGDAACFSFFPTKNLGTMGDGGLVTTSDEELAERIRRLRQHGARVKYVHEEIGFNSRLDELHAAILHVCLKHIDEWNDRRRRLAVRYREQLDGVPGIVMRMPDPDAEHIYHLFCVEAARRDELMDWLNGRNIQCGVYYPVPLHLQPVYSGLGYGPGDFPVAERASQHLLAIPMSPFLEMEEQDAVIAAIRSFGSGGR